MISDQITSITAKIESLLNHLQRRESFNNEFIDETKIHAMNVNSLILKASQMDLQFFSDQYSPDVIIISGTESRDKNGNNEIRNYNVRRLDRSIQASRRHHYLIQTVNGI